MEIRIESELFDPDSHFLFWKPGTVPYVEPDGMALRLDKGTDLVLNTHLQPSGKPELIEPSIGIYFTDKPATEHPMLLQLECDAELDIPPGDANFVVHDEFTLPLDVDVLAIYPHAHYLGKELEATATLPDGTHGDADRHQALGPELAGGLPLRATRAAAQGHDDLDALCLRQFGTQCGQPEPSAQARQRRKPFQR